MALVSTSIGTETASIKHRRSEPGQSRDRRAGVGEAHGGAKTEGGADCGVGGATERARVATESIYPDRSRATLSEVY